MTHPDGTGGLLLLMHGEQKPVWLVQRAPMEVLERLLEDIAEAYQNGHRVKALDIISPEPPEQPETSGGQ